jgi:tetracycline 7-halogenase / FADH2 O2-dependent halogenase
MNRHERADVLIIGAGFAGSLMALIVQRLGLRPILVEKGRHPRFAIGESSTPIANLVLEELARTYHLPRLLPLTKYGRWQAAYPHLACGLKRGFTFMRHEPGREFQPNADHANELLVAASPRDEIGDTHWFREHFDHFVVEKVQAAGIPYLDETQIGFLQNEGGWQLRGTRRGEEVCVEADFLIDASGPSGLLPRLFGFNCGPDTLRTNSWSVYSHFVNVELWEDVLVELGGSLADHPYHCDHAALHHVLDDGWIWVLRFNNGVTSAGIMYDGERRPPERVNPEADWARLMDRYPSVARQFARARPVQPWVVTKRIQRRSERAAGANWAMLAHAAYFIDALYSSGNAHSLLTIERLARILAQHWGRASLSETLAEYEAKLFREVDFVDCLVHGSYRSFRHFDFMASFSMYYFAGAIFSEERRRAGKASPADEFLYSHEPGFRTAFEDGYERLIRLCAGKPSALDSHQYQVQVSRGIAPYNTAGLCDPGKKNMYPYA